MRMDQKKKHQRFVLCACVVGKLTFTSNFNAFMYCLFTYTHGLSMHTSFMNAETLDGNPVHVRLNANTQEMPPTSCASLRIRSCETHANIIIEGMSLFWLTYGCVFHTQHCFFTRKRFLENYADEEIHAHIPEISWSACVSLRMRCFDTHGIVTIYVMLLCTLAYKCFFITDTWLCVRKRLFQTDVCVEMYATAQKKISNACQFVRIRAFHLAHVCILRTQTSFFKWKRLFETHLCVKK